MEFTPELAEFTEEEIELLRAVAQDIPALEEVFYIELEGFRDE